MSYVVLDFETTGLDPERDEVIEFALVRVRDGAVAEHFTSLCRPAGEIPYAAYRVHRISKRETLPFPGFADRLPEVLAYIGSDTVVCHNVPFDMGFLTAYSRRAGVSCHPPTLDTLSLARRHLAYLPSRSLSAVAQHLDIDTGCAHRALDDAMTTARVLLALLERDTVMARQH